MSVTGASVVTCGQCGNAMWVPKPEPPVPASSPVTVIREELERMKAQLGCPVEFAHDDIDCTTARWVGEIRGLEFALRALGVEP